MLSILTLYPSLAPVARPARLNQIEAASKRMSCCTAITNQPVTAPVLLQYKQQLAARAHQPAPQMICWWWSPWHCQGPPTPSPTLINHVRASSCLPGQQQPERSSSSVAAAVAELLKLQFYEQERMQGHAMICEHLGPHLAQLWRWRQHGSCLCLWCLSYPKWCHWTVAESNCHSVLEAGARWLTTKMWITLSLQFTRQYSPAIVCLEICNSGLIYTSRLLCMCLYWQRLESIAN